MTLRTVLTTSALTLAWVALLGTALGCVYAKHEARTRFVALRALELERDQLDVEWGRLRIEQSTWATHSRVENLARDALDMSVPAAGDIAVLEP